MLEPQADQDQQGHQKKMLPLAAPFPPVEVALGPPRACPGSPPISLLCGGSAREGTASCGEAPAASLCVWAASALSPWQPCAQKALLLMVSCCSLEVPTMFSKGPHIFVLYWVLQIMLLVLSYICILMM